MRRYQFAFEVADVPINTRILFSKLATEIGTEGTLFADSEITGVRERVVTIMGRHSVEVEADILVCAAGYGLRRLILKARLGVCVQRLMLITQHLIAGALGI
jgi:hypothetical protein